MTEHITLSAAEQAEIDRAAKIAEQNDRFRRTWGADVTVGSSARRAMSRPLRHQTPRCTSPDLLASVSRKFDAASSGMIEALSAQDPMLSSLVRHSAKVL
ncbi:hypothetical protein ACOI1H_24520 [Loktanella sp. DJP18]|uniref:hypothetical protein n=1 Tax=Loktanella sp. DJP18 TaxID=3409788 RepID=UPI003BB75613